MSIASRFMGWAFKLPPAETHDVIVEKDLQVPMPDGVTLLADRYSPPRPRRAADQSVYHDPAQPSAIVLPLLE